MKTYCLPLLVILVTSSQAAATKDKRLLGLRGGQNDQNGQDNGLLGGVTGTLSSNGLLGSEQGLVGSLLGQNGVIGGLLGNILGGDLLEGLLGDDLLGGISRLVDDLVEEVTSFIVLFVENVLRALDGIDINDTGSVTAAFASIKCNQLCPTCNALLQASIGRACKSFCETNCRWMF